MENKLLEEYIIQNSGILFLETDHDRKILRANNFASNLFGKDLTGLNIEDFVIDFAGDIDFESYINKKEKKKMLNVNTHSGLPKTFYFTFVSEGDKVVIFGESNDSEVEDLRLTLLSLNNDMSNLTRELQKKNVQLNKLNEQKNEFIGMAAHDLRSPISIIMGYSEFILDEAEGQLPEEHIRFLRIILHSSEFMLKMLNDLLDIAKIESGKLNLVKEKISPDKLISNNVVLNRVIAKKKDISINVEIFEQLPDIMADPDKIEQVMNNLISNAIKFSNPNTTVIVSAFSSNEGVTIAVKDDGQGISEQDQEKLFQPFSKLSTRSTAGEKSTGLGLTITKKIILGHGGKIWLESKPDKGTTFYFSLPIK